MRKASWAIVAWNVGFAILGVTILSGIDPAQPGGVAALSIVGVGMFAVWLIGLVILVGIWIGTRPKRMDRAP